MEDARPAIALARFLRLPSRDMRRDHRPAAARRYAVSTDLLLEVAEAARQLRLIADDVACPAPPPTREYEKHVARRLAKMASTLEDVLDRTDPQLRRH